MIAREKQIISLVPTADHTGKEGFAVKNSSGSAALGAAVTDVPIGVITEGAPTTGRSSIALPGFAGTVKVKLGATPGSVVAFSKLEMGTNGTANLASATTGRIIFAEALEAGAANELIEARLLQPYAQ